MTTKENPRPAKSDMPTYLAPESYDGPYSQGKPSNMGVDSYTAQEIAEMIGGAHGLVIWASFGHVHGRERFGRDRILADAEGNLHVYSSTTGAKVVVHPASRSLRILTY